MNLTIPISASDVHLIPSFVAALKYCGSHSRHKCILIPSEMAVNEAKEMARELEPLFASVEVCAVDLGLTGWPMACGRHFRLCAQYMQDKHPQVPWYNCELDCTFIKSGALDILEDDMVRSGKLYYGMVVPTRVHRPISGGGVEYGVMGEHMVGTGIYPWNAYGRSLLMDSVDKVMPWVREPPIPYDVMMCHEIVPYAHNSTLMQHNWRTINYRREGDQIVCDDDPNNAPGTSHKKPVSPNVVMVHGCRDGSLARVLTEPVVAKVAAQQPVAVTAQTVCASPLAIVGYSAPRVTAPNHAPPLVMPSKIIDLAKQIKTLVGDGRLQTTKLAKALKVPKAKVLRVLAVKGIGLALSKKGGWVTVET